MNNLLSTGSSATEDNHSPLMEENYKEVIYFLEQKLIREPKCVESIREWILSYHALAEIYQQRGELDLAQQCLFIPHKSMIYMAQCYAHDDEFESIAASAIGLTLPPANATGSDISTLRPLHAGTTGPAGNIEE